MVSTIYESCPRCKGTGKIPIARGDPLIDSAEELLHVLMHATPHRELYVDQQGIWRLTYGGGPFPREWVEQLVAQRKIQSVYSNIPTQAYHVGKTWDCERTLEARKRLGKAAPNYFVGDL